MPRTKKNVKTIQIKDSEIVISGIMKNGKASQGRKELITYIKTGTPLTKTQAIKAMCNACMGYYADGVGDCGSIICPLYPFMPYSGVATKVKTGRKLTEEQKAAMQTGRKNAKQRQDSQ